MKIETKEYDNGNLIINTAFESLLTQNSINSFSDLWSLPGEPVKKRLAERGTERVILKSEDGPVETYIKRYLPLPFKEYFKGITSFRPFFPSGALHEWDAVLAFHRENISTMLPIAVGKDTSGKSAIITLAIKDYTRASDLFREMKEEKSSSFRTLRRELIASIAKLAGKMHAAEFAHQDFYLVHLFVQKNMSVQPIDLQRIIMGNRFSRRWRVKDLGQLLYSALPFTSLTDRLYFWKIYSEITNTDFFRDKGLIRSVIKKADRINNRSIRKKRKKSL